jgi:PAS domain S-box-containing protein
MAGQLFNDLEKSTSGIITINRDGVIQSVDRNAAQLFGYTLGELLNEKINIIIPPPYKEQHDSYIQNYHRTGQKKIINTTRYVEGQHKSGTVFRIRLSVNEVMNGQLYIGLIERADTDIASMTCDENGLITVCNSSCCKLFGYSNTSQLIGKPITSLVVRSADDENYFSRYRDRAQALKGAYKVRFPSFFQKLFMI